MRVVWWPKSQNMKREWAPNTLIEIRIFLARGLGKGTPESQRVQENTHSFSFFLLLSPDFVLGLTPVTAIVTVAVAVQAPKICFLD